jgi:hemerythrin superfamily protein
MTNRTLTETLSPYITNMIRLDHTHVLATFHQYKTTSRPQIKRGLVNTVCLALEVHAQLEEEIFYPAVRAVTENETIRKSVPEHDEMRRLIAQLRSMEPTDPRYDETFMELMRDVMHHVADEETVLLPEAERLLHDRLGELGLKMTKRRMELVLPRAGDIAVNMARAVPLSSVATFASVLLAGLWMGRRRSRA